MPGRGQGRVSVGVVARAHGIRGELRIHLHNPASTALQSADEVLVGGVPYAIEATRAANGAVLLALVGVEDRNAAERLKGAVLEVSREALDLDDDEVLLGDLVGLRAVLADGSEWGVIEAIENGPQDRLIVRCGEVVRQLPVVDAFVLAVDLDAETVLVDPPEDLPEDG